MTNPYSPVPELNSASSEVVTKVAAHGIRQQFPCYLLLLSFCLLACGIAPYTLRAMLDPSCLAADERPSGPAMMAILGATGVNFYGIIVAVVTILTLSSWFRTRLVEISTIVAAFCVLSFFMSVLAATSDLISSLSLGSASVFGAAWFGWLAMRCGTTCMT